MDHQFLFSEPDTKVEVLLLNHPDYNLDKSDSLVDIPESPGVFAVSGRVNGEPANCRLVRAADNIQQAVRSLYENSEQDECIRNYMQSIKTKLLVYQVMPEADQAEMDKHVAEWKAQYDPQCNEELNKVY